MLVQGVPPHIMRILRSLPLRSIHDRITRDGRRPARRIRHRPLRAARFLADVREHRVPGIHAQTLSTNEPIARFNRAAGLRMVHTQPLTCFAHAGETSLAVHTWVRDIDGSS